MKQSMRIWGGGRPGLVWSVLVGLVATGAVHGLRADDREQLLAELRELRARLAALEARVASAPAGPTAAVVPSPAVATNTPPATPADLERRMAATEKGMADLDRKVSEQSTRLEKMREKTDQTSPELVAKALKGKWYERISLRGYAQLRYSHLIDYEGAPLNSPNDRSVGEGPSFLLRRGRFIFSGDVSERLFLYGQMDFNGSPTDGDFAVQMRDLYADVSFDSKKEFRLRAGQSKVPFGYVNMQSSQNRAPLERADALNGAVEGERDIGAFLYWAPAEARVRFRDLVRQGLKGSGDYGVAGIGAYSGQGLNRSDLNGEPHYIARLAYPWKLKNGQFIEAGIQAYAGRFVVSTEEIAVDGTRVRPAAPSQGLDDHRVGLTAVWYPQPFGVEAEWNIGEGPELGSDRRSVGTEFLHGGYVQLNYKVDDRWGTWFPFTRWQYYDGGRKFARNAPSMDVNELDFGVEWQPIPDLEVTVAYTHTFTRTNTRTAPYADTENADRVGFQLQWNY